MLKNPPANAGDARGTGLIIGSGRYAGEGNDDPLHHAWRTPWTGEPGGLRSMGSQSQV